MEEQQDKTETRRRSKKDTVPQGETRKRRAAGQPVGAEEDAFLPTADGWAPVRPRHRVLC